MYSEVDNLFQVSRGLCPGLISYRDTGSVVINNTFEKQDNQSECCFRAKTSLISALNLNKAD